MTTKRLKRPRDAIQLGKLIVEIATGQIEDREGSSEQSDKNAAAIARQNGRPEGWAGPPCNLFTVARQHARAA